MSTITKEWLQQKISGMESARDDIPFGLDEDDSNTLAALRIALASLEAEPVVKLPNEFISSEGIVVQIEKLMAVLAVHGIQYERKGNSCRAAMLQGDQPVSNRDELPDVELETNESDRHWYLVSWCAKGGYVGFTDIYLSSPWANGSARKVAEIISELNMVTDLVITSVFPMPAATQQEVKP